MDSFVVRKTTIDDIAAMMLIYDRARQFMQHTDNPNQWINGYPSQSVINSDIAQGSSYVCEDQDGDILATFCFFVGEESSYAEIYDGRWLNDREYGVVHRLASSGKAKGIARFCLEWCYEKCKNLRIDTHADNKVMQQVLAKEGYVKCGTIIINDGSSRVAFQKC